jgi:hypothetical protein
MQMESRKAIGIYVVASVTLTAISLLFWGTGFTARHSFLLRFIFFDPALPGTDLTLYDRLLSWPKIGALAFNPSGTVCSFNYCPLSVFLVVAFLRLPSHPALALAIFVGSAVLIAAFFLGRAIAGNHLALAALVTALATSYPFGFLFERGNIEGLLWIPTAAGIYYFARKHYLTAALLIGLAASIKPFPGLLLLLLIPRRRYRDFFIGVATTLAITIASLFIIGPSFTIAVQEFLRGFKLFSESYVTIYNSSALGSDHALFALVKLLVRAAAGWPLKGPSLNALVRGALPYYFVLCGLVCIVAFYRMRTLPALNQIFGLVVLTVLISPTNYDYTLIAMYIPWAILLLTLGRPGCAIPIPVATSLMICCSVLFTSQFYLLFGLSTAFSGPVKTLALCTILIVSTIYPLPASALDESRNLNKERM